MLYNFYLNLNKIYTIVSSTIIIAAAAAVATTTTRLSINNETTSLPNYYFFAGIGGKVRPDFGCITDVLTGGVVIKVMGGASLRFNILISVFNASISVVWNLI
jgi:hypothetical protein